MKLLIRQDWFGDVYQQCPINPVEPTISIINFTIKTSFAIVISPILFISIFYRYLTASRGSLPEKSKSLGKGRPTLNS